MNEITLDRKTFEALAIDTRVNILKSLKQRRKTQAELSKEMSLAASTISEHLDKMLNAELIRREEQGKKWIYYALTDKGKGIVEPKQSSVFVFSLGISLILIFAGIFTAWQPMNAVDDSMMAKGMNYAAGQEMMTASAHVADRTTEENGTDYLPYALIALGLIAFALTIRYKKH
jgi:DNA-binding transcriptional ArsR family regulator